MNVHEAMRERHSVRSYTDQAIPESIVSTLADEIARCNQEGNLALELVTDDPGAFDSMMARYGRFSGVRNYIVCRGRKDATLDQRIGYYGQRIVLLAKMLGLDSCWVGITFNKRSVRKNLERGMHLACVIVVGYGTTHGTPHKSKNIDTRFKVADGLEPPDWFMKGMEAAMLAPTAVNQQRFVFWLEPGNVVRAESTGGAYSNIDLGIAKCHFEIGAGTDNFAWNSTKAKTARKKRSQRVRS